MRGKWEFYKKMQLVGTDVGKYMGSHFSQAIHNSSTLLRFSIWQKAFGSHECDWTKMHLLSLSKFNVINRDPGLNR